MSRSARAFAALSLVLAACSPDVDPSVRDSGTSRDVATTDDDSATGGTLVLELIRPDRGTTAGGMSFEIFGRGFVEGARVTFLLSGTELDATEVTASDTTRLTGRTPATAGVVGRASVRVSLPTGRTATLPDAFTFVDAVDAGAPEDMLVPPPPPPIDMGPAPEDMFVPPPVDMFVPPPVDMFVPPPVDMFVPPMDSGPADTGPRDMGPMDSGPADTGPRDMGPVDSGPRDLGPMDSGPADTGPPDMGPVDSGPIDAGPPRPTVCLVEGAVDSSPASGSFVHGYLAPLTSPTRGTRIQLTIPGLSGAPGASPGVVVELGRGPLPALGSDDVSSWAWSTMTYLTDAGTIETYAATILAPIDPGEYGIAARVTVSGGAPVYCDLDGIANGFSASMTGVFTVMPTGAADPDYCHIQSPLAPPAGTALTGRPLGTLSDYVYGWINESGVTPGAGAGAGVTAQVGYGPVGSYPSTARWTWTTASYNTDVSGGSDDEYWDNPMRIIAPGVGSYDIAYRFRVNTGGFRYCDSRDHLGSTNDYHPSGAIRMTITP